MYGINTFGAILYINLSHREDRKRHIEAVLKKAQVDFGKVFRIEALFDPLNGHLGCAKSHLKAIHFAKEKNLKTILILEDDFTFTKEDEFVKNSINYFFSSIKEEWDVFFLSAKVHEYHDACAGIKRVVSARGGHAYAVHSHYYDRLSKCYESSIQAMQEHSFFFETDANGGALDQVWDSLMKEDRWYIGSHILGEQIGGFSDIAQGDILRPIPYTYLE